MLALTSWFVLTTQAVVATEAPRDGNFDVPAQIIPVINLGVDQSSSNPVAQSVQSTIPKDDATNRRTDQELSRLKLEEVIVTAQRRKEDLQSVPVSVQVINSQVLAEQNRNTLEDLSETLPGVHISTGANGVNGSNEIFIRGVGSGIDPSFDQSVTMFTDDIYKGRSRLTSVTFLDLDRVEVLKGPQTTFFGNNAIAGALNIVTKRPGDRFEAWARALYGEFGQYAIEGAVGGPITDALGIRVAVTRNGDDRGWLENINTNERIPRTNNMAGRVTVSLKASDDLEAIAKVESTRHRTSGSPYEQPVQYVNCPPPAPLTTDFGGTGGCAQALSLGVPIGSDQDKVSGLGGQANWLSTSEGVLTINYRRWGQTFTSVSGLYKYNYGNNVDDLNLPVVMFSGSGTEHYHQFTQEFRITSPTGRMFEYLAGAYFQTDRLDFAGYGYAPIFDFLAGAGLFPQFAPYLHIGALGSFPQGEHIHSVFGSLTWNLTDRLKVNTGLRASSVRKAASGTSLYGTGTGPYCCFEQVPAGALAPIFNDGQSETLKRTDNALMPSTGIQYQLLPQAMVYFTYTKGFKAGGFEGQQLGAQAVQGLQAFSAYGPEHVDSYELGLKSKWFDDRLLLNLDLFRGDYKDLQTFASIYLPLTNSYGGEVVNAAFSRSQGIELEGQWLIGRELRIGTNVTYLDSHYVSFPNANLSTLQQFCSQANSGGTIAECNSKAPNPIPGVRNLAGQQTPYAPRLSGSVNIRHSVLLSGIYKISTEISPYFTSSYWSSFGPDDIVPRTKGYVRLDARIGFEMPDRHWGVDVVGKNLTDRVILTNTDVYSASREQPRNVAVQFRYLW